MIKCSHLKELVVVPVLKAMGPSYYSEAAVNLLLGTAAKESEMGFYLKQLGRGPALGIYQMEPETYKWMLTILNKDFGDPNSKRFTLRGNLLEYLPQHDGPANTMIFNLAWATIMCRLRYYVVKAPLPAADDIAGLARYWKKYYNTSAGKGTEQEFINAYRKYVK